MNILNVYQFAHTNPQAVAHSIFWLVNPIKIHHKNVIANPSPTPITIQLFFCNKIEGI
jgi:hypothetical protein